LEGGRGGKNQRKKKNSLKCPRGRRRDEIILGAKRGLIFLGFFHGGEKKKNKPESCLSICGKEGKTKKRKGGNTCFVSCSGFAFRGKIRREGGERRGKIEVLRHASKRHRNQRKCTISPEKITKGKGWKGIKNRPVAGKKNVEFGDIATKNERGEKQPRKEKVRWKNLVPREVLRKLVKKGERRKWNPFSAFLPCNKRKDRADSFNLQKITGEEGGGKPQTSKDRKLLPRGKTGGKKEM